MLILSLIFDFAWFDKKYLQHDCDFYKGAKHELYGGFRRTAGKRGRKYLNKSLQRYNYQKPFNYPKLQIWQPYIISFKSGNDRFFN